MTTFGITIIKDEKKKAKVIRALTADDAVRVAHDKYKGYRVQGVVPLYHR